MRKVLPCLPQSMKLEGSQLMFFKVTDTLYMYRDAEGFTWTFFSNLQEKIQKKWECVSISECMADGCVELYSFISDTERSIFIKRIEFVSLLFSFTFLSN